MGDSLVPTNSTSIVVTLSRWRGGCVVLIPLSLGLAYIFSGRVTTFFPRERRCVIFLGQRHSLLFGFIVAEIAKHHDAAR